jgi:hypothetical protein
MDYIRRYVALLALVALALGLSGCGMLRGSKVPAATFSKAQSFEQSCDAVWTEMARGMGRAGFRAMQNDREAGLATFLWNSPQLPVVAGAGNNPERLALGTFKDLSSLRVESALLTLESAGRGCTANLSISYKGREPGFWNSDWMDVPSSGLMENCLLTAALPKFAMKSHRTRASAE